MWKDGERTHSHQTTNIAVARLCYEELRSSLNMRELNEVVDELRSINALPDTFSEATVTRIMQQNKDTVCD